MREQLSSRREARRKQLRFRKYPAAYLAALEKILLKTSLPSYDIIVFVCYHSLLDCFCIFVTFYPRRAIWA